ncbi:glycosyl transferase [Hyphomicrobium nitrativorans NL23]|uniref:Glycosyl transferase n=1 Tax=Hyphomicrobium nitrativorans NL23 TaxID=1029756 RepID=V5SAP6_9HYPH|nr:glycosyltransferase [Hyphomicrobium nitrativorans]AHB47821.1 glycosyl transferase [Hyphomicrobium nitrativorans NL23]
MAEIDILLPVRNGAEYLSQAITSIRNQTHRDWRLWVLDHCSDDASAEIALSHGEQDPRVQIRSLEADGLSDLLNKGLDLCDSRFVARQDADDISLPHRLESLVSAMNTDPALDLVGSNATTLDASGKFLGHIEYPTSAHGVTANALFFTPLLHPTVLYRHDTLRQLEVRYGIDFMRWLPSERRTTIPALAEDYFLFAQLAFLGRCANLPERLLLYRLHGNNVGYTKFVAQSQVALDISRYMVASLSQREGLEPFDPAPFCNHAMQLIDIPGRTDFSDEHRQLTALMTRVMQPSHDLSRVLSFSSCLRNRRKPIMMQRYLKHRSRFGHNDREYLTVRSWLIPRALRKLRKRPHLTLSPSGLTSTP